MFTPAGTPPRQAKFILNAQSKADFDPYQQIGSDLQDRVCGRYGVSLQPGPTRSTAPNMMTSIATGGWLHDAMRQNEAHGPDERDE